MWIISTAPAKGRAASASPLDSKSLHLLHNTAVGEAPPYPILQAHFDNCLIDGSFSAGNPLSATGEIGIVASATNEEEDFDYRFNHCVLKAQSIESEHFIETLFINPQEPPYRMTGGEANKYIYDFRLNSVSAPGVGQADLEIAREYPMDRYGVNRLSNPNGPTIGAYEFVPEEDNEETAE